MAQLVGYLLLFTVVGIGFILVHLLAGKFLRPAKPETEKLAIYECGEPTVGSAWVQFDLRFYVVALLFVIFDVEVAFFFPWAVVFGKASTLANPRLPPEQRVQVTRELEPSYALPSSGTLTPPEEQPQAAHDLAWIAFGDILVFFGVLLVGFAYLWKRGDLDWVRSTAAERFPVPLASELPPSPPAEADVLVGASRE
ncbi:MAG: NADH-quinone oxidoreductase subunit A [Planctomycetes bacterium]|nr:NADH-quinone oxidoreductase subunit A [Planctomycetota bacterium]